MSNARDSIRIPPSDLSIEEISRILGKIFRRGECWIWGASVDVGGYGKIKIRGHSYGAHRVIYCAFGGSLNHGQLACHSCDTPACVNPSHIFPGSDMDNARDREAKGRGVRIPLRGELSPNCRYSDATVRMAIDMVKSGISAWHVAKKVGCAKETVGRWMTGESRREVANV